MQAESEQNGPSRSRRRASVSIALAGSGGSGVMTAGTLLLDAAAKAGLYGLMVRTSGPQIRGGEAAALVRLGDAPMDGLDDRFDLLLAIDWQNVNRFADEIPLARDERDDRRPGRGRAARGVPQCRRALRPAAAQEDGQGHRRAAGPNMVALGVAGALAGLPAEALEAAVRDSWKRADDALAANLAALHAGVGRRRGHRRRAEARRAAKGSPAQRWLISGNEAAGYGAIRGGVRFVAAYPITPATELLEWMAPALAKVGGTLLQAEDELASINMIIGASYGGVPSLTATAGPGPRADDRGHRARRQRRGPDRRRRRDARRPVDRHPGEERAERPLVRGERPARRRAAARARADVDRRLPRDDAVGGGARRGAAGAGDRAVRPVHGPVARDHRPARRRRASSAGG